MLTTSDILEALYRARASLNDENESFKFSCWTTCACGHVYAGATRHRAASEADVFDRPTNPEYKRVIVAAAEALGWKGERDLSVYDAEDPFYRDMPPAGWAACYVSNYTAKQWSTRERAAAVVDEAIAVIEAEQERDRLDVLAQARTVVDDAATLRPVYNAATHAIEFVEVMA